MEDPAQRGGGRGCISIINSKTTKPRPIERFGYKKSPNRISEEGDGQFGRVSRRGDRIWNRYGVILELLSDGNYLQTAPSERTTGNSKAS